MVTYAINTHNTQISHQNVYSSVVSLTST